MSLQLQDILQRTRTCINEYVPADAVLDDFEEQTDENLKVFIDAAVRMVAGMAPNYTMNVVTKTTSDTTDPLTVTWEQRPDGRYKGTFSLPGDFLRLESLDAGNGSTTSPTKLRRKITKLLWEYDPSYGEQTSSSPGIGAGEYEPKAYRIDDEVEIHSLGQGTGISTTMKYIPVPTLSTGSNPEYATLKPILMDAVCWHAAALYLSMTESEYVKNAKENATASMTALISQAPRQGEDRIG